MSGEKIDFFLKELFKWYRANGRHTLPWRKKNVGAYEVWVSEIMLQQTQVSRVIPFYKKFLIRFPTIEKLSQAKWKIFFPYYRGLGYYRRGRNMLETARIIVKEYDGSFPKNKEKLKKLPGVGEYTARAILSFGYKKPYLAQDTNQKHLLGRFFKGKKDAIVSSNEIENFCNRPFWRLNAAMMDFAHSVCARRPKCSICPLQKKCYYYQTGGKKELFIPLSSIKFPTRGAQVFLWLHNEHKEYYSSNIEQFEVFRLSKEYNTRKRIKEYFKRNYNLELAERPPHRKVFLEGIPTLFMNAQILLGKHQFGVFSSREVKNINMV